MDVVKGATGDFTTFFFSTLEISKFLLDNSKNNAFVSSSFFVFFFNSAQKVLSSTVLKLATTLNDFSDLKLRISLSRSTIIFTATD